MTPKEHAIITTLVLCLIMGFLFLGGCATSPPSGIPKVIDHDISMSLSDVQGACVEYTATQGKPCAVITEGARVCYAYMELDGSSKPVNCFNRMGE